MRKKRAVSLLLVMVLCLGMTFQAQAANLSDAKKKQKSWNRKKEAAQSEKIHFLHSLKGF